MIYSCASRCRSCGNPFSDRPATAPSGRQSYTPVNALDDDEYFSARSTSPSGGRSVEMTRSPATAGGYQNPTVASPPGDSARAPKSNSIGSLKISKAARESGDGVAPKRGTIKKINKHPR